MTNSDRCSPSTHPTPESTSHQALRCAICNQPSVDSSATWHIDAHHIVTMFCRACALDIFAIIDHLGGTMTDLLSIPIDPDIDEAEHHWTCRCMECVDQINAIDDFLFERRRDERAS